MDPILEKCIEGVALFVATLWVRSRGKRDTEKVADKVIKSTAAQSTSEEILRKISELELDMRLVKSHLFGDTSIDHRGPRR